MCWVLCQGPLKGDVRQNPSQICTTWTTSDPKLHRCPSEPASQNTFNRIDPWKKAKIRDPSDSHQKWPIKTTLWSCTLSILKHQFANNITQECCCYWWMLPYDVWHIFKKMVDWCLMLLAFCLFLIYSTHMIWKKLPTLKQPHPVQPTESYNLEKKHQMWNVMATFGWLLFVRFIFQECLFYTSCSYYMLLSEPYCCWTGNLGRFARFSILGSAV